MRNTKLLALALACAVALSAVAGLAYAATVFTKSASAHARIVASTPGAVSYSATIQPIFNSSCVSCHGVRGAEDINLTSYPATMGSRVVVPGRASNSKLYRAVRDAGDDRMPPGGNLSAAQAQAIADWINQGARDN